MGPWGLLSLLTVRGWGKYSVRLTVIYLLVYAFPEKWSKKIPVFGTLLDRKSPQPTHPPPWTLIVIKAKNGLDTSLEMDIRFFHSSPINY